MLNLRGTGVAIVTPFNTDGSVDFDALDILVNHLIDNGIDYLVVQGTTGESVTLSSNEKKEVLEAVVKRNNGRVPVVLGIGGNSTVAVCETIEATDLSGVDAILSVSPYYNKPTQEGIYQHYKAISSVSPIPIILYNVPGRTSSNILPETTLRLARDFDNIIAVKEASGDLEQSMKIIQNKPEGFMVISGDDALTLPLMVCGGDGVISVIANAFPKGFSDMVSAALNNDFTSAKELHYKYYEAINYLFVEGNPAGVKAALEILGIMKDTVRLPLVPVSEATRIELLKFIKKLSVELV